MKLNESTSLVLKIFVYLGVAIMAVGLLLSEEDIGGDVLWTGILFLLLAPIAGLATTYASLVKEKDWYWTKIATILAIMIVLGILVALVI